MVRARGSKHVTMLEMVEVGEEHLIGEVIGLNGDEITVQVYEETSGMRPGEPVFGTGMPLSVELGPGVMRSIVDGIQRPLPVMERRTGAFIGRGIRVTPLYYEGKWHFTPLVKTGETLSGGTIIGSVPETSTVEHKVMLPPDVHGTLTWIADEGDYTVVDPIARIKTPRAKKRSRCCRGGRYVKPRPFKTRLEPSQPLITGQRVLDTFFPLAKGGAAAIPGGFGAGKNHHPAPDRQMVGCPGGWSISAAVNAATR